MYKRQSVALIVSYFLIAASYSGGFATFDSKDSTIIVFIGVVAFFGIMAEATIIQQKCVDTTKQMNPEKKASAYDMRFQKKWLEAVSYTHLDVYKRQGRSSIRTGWP